MENLKTRLREFTITKIDYIFQNNLSDILEIFPQISKDAFETLEFSSNIAHDPSVKVAIHNELLELYVEIDLRIQEEIDLKEAITVESDENSIFPVKSLDLSVRYYFDIEFSGKDEVEVNEYLIGEVRELVSDSVVQIARHEIISLVKVITSIDYSSPLIIKFPESHFKID